MLGLYTLIIGHKFCSMLRIENNLTLQKELQKCHIIIFWTKGKSQQQQNKNANTKILVRAGNHRTRDLLPLKER